jgi:hypothetical protein
MNFMNAFDNPNNEQPRKSGLDAFDQTEAAPAWKPLPAGIYTARIVSGQFTQTKKGDDAYRINFEITEGEHKGKRTSRTWTFTDKALPYAKHDLALFGLTTSQQLLEPFPPTGREYFVRLTIALQRRDDGSEGNDIKRFEMLREEQTPGAEFLIDPNQNEGGKA